MIFVTGASGFVGKSLVPLLIKKGYEVRCLVNNTSVDSIYGMMPVEQIHIDLNDLQSIRSSLVGIDTIVHLASAHSFGSIDNLMDIDYILTRQLLEAGRDMGIRRFVYPSCLSANRASAYAILKVKGVIEEFVKKSGIPFTIVRSASVYGRDDTFTNVLAGLMKFAPFVFPRPGNGQAVRQPIWIGDYVECISQVLLDDRFTNAQINIGGPEFITSDDLLKSIMNVVGVKRVLVSMSVTQMQWTVNYLRKIVGNRLVTSNWIDHISRDCNCEINSLQRYFGIRPSQFRQSIDYLTGN